jgi:hypothetical protein
LRTLDKPAAIEGLQRQWLLACKSGQQLTSICFLHHHHYSTYAAITPLTPKEKENCDIVYMWNALAVPKPKPQTKDRTKT